MEKEIENILLSIKKIEIRTYADIKKIREQAVDDIFEDFMCYPRNQVNIKKIKDELDGFELVNIENLLKNDTIKYCNKLIFYDIEMCECRVINHRPNNAFSVRMHGTDAWKELRDGPFFKKLTEEDKVKISLIEADYAENK